MKASFLSRHRKRLRNMSWSFVLGLAFNILVAMLLLTIGAAPGSVRSQLKPLAGMAIAGLVAAKFLSGRYDGCARLRRVRASGGAMGAQLVALLPVALLAWMRIDRANVRAAGQWLARRPLPVPPAGDALGFLARSSYATLFALALVVLLVELPLDGMIAGVMTNDPVQRVWLRLVLASLVVYSIIWLLGDRRQLQAGYVVVDEHQLMLEMGARLSARLPVPAIVSARIVAGGMGAWCEQHGVDPGMRMLATPADGANVVLELDPAAQLRVDHWHVEREAPRYLFLFVDEPGKLLAILSSRRAR